MNEEKVKWLGLNPEGRLNIDFHGNTLLKEASKKYHVLARGQKAKKKHEQKETTYSHESFRNISVFLLPSCLDIPYKTRSNRINKIHKKSLRVVYKDETNLTFGDLMKKDKSVSIHQRNQQILATET